jgi:hypothetical protein
VKKNRVTKDHSNVGHAAASLVIALNAMDSSSATIAFKARYQL